MVQIYIHGLCDDLCFTVNLLSKSFQAMYVLTNQPTIELPNRFKVISPSFIICENDAGNDIVCYPGCGNDFINIHCETGTNVNIKLTLLRT